MAYWSDSGIRATSFAGGSGTSSSPYLISTPAQLGYLCYLINSSTSSSYKSKYYKVTANLDMSDNKWIPIGYASNSYSFTGTFDGDGYWINYLTVEGSYSGAGLFGYISSSCNIKNIKLESPEFTLSGSSATYSGFIAGYSNTSNISNIHISSGWLKSSNTTTNYIGGIVGMDYNPTTITDVYLDSCTIETTSTSHRIGGITGWTNSAKLTVERANIYLTVISSSSAGTNYCVGGVVGYNSNSNSSYIISLTDINISLNVTNKSSSSTMGGLIGNLSTNIKASNILLEHVSIYKCYYSGSANTYDGALVGGSYTCTINPVSGSTLLLDYNTDNSNITKYTNGVSTSLTTYYSSFSSDFKPSGGYYDDSGNNVKTYMINTHGNGENWVLNGTTPFVKVPYGLSSPKRVYALQLVDWEWIYLFGGTGDQTIKVIYTTASTYKLPFPDKYAYLGITLKVQSSDGNTTYMSNASPGTSISIGADKKITVNTLDKTKLISYKKDSSTTVEVEDICYKSDSSTIKTVNDYKYKKDSSTIV